MLFAEFGQVQTATVVFDRITHRSKRFGFVKMPIRAEADQAMNSLDGKRIDGRNIKVDPAIVSDTVEDDIFDWE
jgi:RNA recognition motif-containing protein